MATSNEMSVPIKPLHLTATASNITKIKISSAVAAGERDRYA